MSALNQKLADIQSEMLRLNQQIPAQLAETLKKQAENISNSNLKAATLIVPEIPSADPLISAETKQPVIGLETLLRRMIASADPSSKILASKSHKPHRRTDLDTGNSQIDESLGFDQASRIYSTSVDDSEFDPKQNKGLLAQLEHILDRAKERSDPTATDEMIARDIARSKSTRKSKNLLANSQTQTSMPSFRTQFAVSNLKTADGSMLRTIERKSHPKIHSKPAIGEISSSITHSSQCSCPSFQSFIVTPVPPLQPKQFGRAATKNDPTSTESKIKAGNTGDSSILFEHDTSMIRSLAEVVNELEFNSCNASLFSSS